MEANDGFLLPRLQPEIPGNPPIVLIHSPVALAPVVELAGPNAQPLRESPDADLGLLRPTSDKIHHLIPRIMRHPILGQSSPRLFLARCARPSVRPGLRPWSALSSPRTRSVSASPRPDEWVVPSLGRQRLRFQRTPSASDTRRWVVVHFPHTDRKPGPCLKDGVAEWPPFLQRCSACALFSYVRSVILTDERSLHLDAAGEKDEVKRQFEELRNFFFAPGDGSDRSGIEIFRHKIQQELTRGGQPFREFKDARIACRNDLDRRIEEQRQWPVERSDYQGDAIRLSIDFGGVSAFPKSLGNDYIYGLHPLFQLSLRESCGPHGSHDLEDFFLASGLEITAHCGL